MTDTLDTAVDPETTEVEEALEAFLAANDPSALSPVEYRGARYDAGLAWVHFPEGFGGLGVRPELQAVVERRLREAGAPATARTPCSSAWPWPGRPIVTHGSDERARPPACARCSPARRSGASSSASRAPAPTSPACRPGPSATATSGSSTARRCGPRSPTSPTGACSSPAPTPTQPKHKGLTYFVVDMHAPGVEVRPLRQITGEAEFNEVYFTDVRVPDADRIGDVGEGWRVSMTTLMNERTTIGGGGGHAPPGQRRRSPRPCDLWTSAGPTRTRSRGTGSCSCGSRPRCCGSPTCGPAPNAPGRQPRARGLDRQARRSPS